MFSPIEGAAMTAKSENELLTRTDAGTPMGDLMRYYWIPAARSDELTSDGDPMRLKLLGKS
jgi:phthalate 4,5-dioxygenase oxygenase subunit